MSNVRVFATIAVIFPQKSGVNLGGDVVEIATNKVVFCHRCSDSVQLLCWYSDREVYYHSTPMKAGYQVAATFLCYQESPLSIPTFSGVTSNIDKLSQVLGELHTSNLEGPSQDFIVCPLSGNYARHHLTMKLTRIKDEDARLLLRLQDIVRALSANGVSFTVGVGVLARTQIRVRSFGPSSIRTAVAEAERRASKDRVADDYEEEITKDRVELYRLFEPEQLGSECLFGRDAVQLAIKESLPNASTLISYNLSDVMYIGYPEYITHNPGLRSLHPRTQKPSVSNSTVVLSCIASPIFTFQQPDMEGNLTDKRCKAKLLSETVVVNTDIPCRRLSSCFGYPHKEGCRVHPLGVTTEKASDP